VVGHQAISRNPHVEYFRCVYEKLNEARIILPGGEGVLAEPGTVHDVIPCICEFYSKWSGHDLYIYQIIIDKSIKDVTLLSIFNCLTFILKYTLVYLTSSNVRIRLFSNRSAACRR